MIDKQGIRARPNEEGEEALRARFYTLLSTLLARSPDASAIALMQSLEGDDTAMGQALASLADKARTLSSDEIEDEYTLLFFGVGAGGELLPYASHYLTGLLYDKPLADLRGDLKRLGLGVDREVTEPEDHIATVLEIMHTLIEGHRGPGGDGCQQSFFKTHLLPWATNFFIDLEQAENASLYVPVGTIGRLLMDIEQHAFEMAA